MTRVVASSGDETMGARFTASKATSSGRLHRTPETARTKNDHEKSRQKYNDERHAPQARASCFSVRFSHAPQRLTFKKVNMAKQYVVHGHSVYRCVR